MKRRTLSCLLALALSSAGTAQAPAPPPEPPLIPPATIDDTLEVTGEQVAALPVRTRMTVAVTIGAHGPFRFIVDSGADRSVIGAALARELALPGEGRVTLHSMAGTSQVDTVRLEGLRVGSSLIPPISAPALPERFVGAQGLLGIDALADQRLLMDFDRKTIVIQDSSRPAPSIPGSQEIVVTARRRHGQLILTQAVAGGRSLYAVIDSGSDISIGNSALRRRIFASRHPPPATTIKLTSVTGEEILAELLVLPELRIGGIILSNVPMAFVDAPPFALFGIARQPAILLGTDVLQAFRRVSLDFHNRKVRFALR